MKKLQYVLLAVALLVAGLLGYDVSVRLQRKTAPAADVDGRALGRAYAPAVVATLADAWTQAADALAKGATVAKAQQALQDAWHDARVKQFATIVSPGFAKILPQDAEPKDDAQRAETVKLWQDFASGLKGGAK